MQQRNLYGVALTPRRSGALVVPGLQVGSTRTAPLTLQVDAAAVAGPDSNAMAFIETVVDDPTPYVQQSVGVVVRLYFASQLASGELVLDTRRARHCSAWAMTAPMCARSMAAATTWSNGVSC